MYGKTFYGRHTAQIALLIISNDIAYTGERTRTVTATAPILAIPTTLPTELSGTSQRKVDRKTLINVIITA
jgi:hypothetical protein